MTGELICINRLRMATDGSGVSTLVGLADCPLRCRYCFNYFGKGIKTYPLFGQHYSAIYDVGKLLKTLQKDDIYFKMTGGGIVFGGGEPLRQAEFIHEVCQLADPMWQKRIETSLYSQWENVEILLDDMDEWIIDIKDMNPNIYKEYTGKTNDCVIANLKKLVDRVSVDRIRIRVPHIPNFNSDINVKMSIEKLREFGFTRIEEFTYIALK